MKKFWQKLKRFLGQALNRDYLLCEEIEVNIKYRDNPEVRRFLANREQIATELGRQYKEAYIFCNSVPQDQVGLLKMYQGKQLIGLARLRLRLLGRSFVIWCDFV